MASPVGHTLAGLTIYLVVHRHQPNRSCPISWQALLPYLLLPNLPDIDFLISYILYADANLLHGSRSGITHSLGATLLMSLLAIPMDLFRSPLRTFFLALALLSSHLLLDMASGELFKGGKGYGVMLLYPFSDQTFHLPVTILWGPRHQTWADLCSVENVLGVVWEFLIFTPTLVCLGTVIQKRRVFFDREQSHE